jgi:hypothetical protein
MTDNVQTIGAVTPTNEDLKSKYGQIYRVSTTVQPDDDTSVDLEYVFKKPNVASYDRYVKTAANGATKALQAFLFDNIVDEHQKKLEDDLEVYPALALGIGEKLLSMLGLSKDVNLKKL